MSVMTDGSFGLIEMQKSFLGGRKKDVVVSGEGILLQKGGIPATPSGTATLLRLSPSR